MMKKLVALLMSLLLISTMLVGLILPVSADGPYTATFEDKTYEATPANADEPKVYYLTISSDAPAELLRKVNYYVDGKIFHGASEPGTYTVKAKLPSGRFVDKSGQAISELTATLTLTGATQDLAVIVVDAAGNKVDAYAQQKEQTVPANLLKKAAASQVLSFDIKNGTAGEKYLLRISINSDLYTVKSKGITKNSLSLYENNKLVSPSEKGYTVELKDGRFEISNVPADAQMTVVITAQKAGTFPWWIILIVVLVLLLVCMFFVGRARTQREEEEAKKAEAEQQPTDEKPAEPAEKVAEGQQPEEKETTKPADEAPKKE